jgi:hypothetical protein
MSLSTLLAEVDIGFYGSITSFSFSGKAPDGSEYSSIRGYGGTFVLDIYLIKDLALSLQPGYLQKGSAIVFQNRWNDDKIDSTFLVRQECVNLPLNFKFYTPSRHFYFLGGINLDYFLESTIEKDGEEKQIDISNFLKAYDLSMNFGIAYQYFIKSFNFFLELRYTQGFSNMNKSHYYSTQDETSAYISNFKNGGVLLILGLSFRIY